MGGVVLAQGPPRKVLVKAPPIYPELAKRMRLSGAVRMEVVITPAGAVKSAKMLGGNPVFEQSALEAAKHWRFAPAGKETKALILVHFVGP